MHSVSQITMRRVAATMALLFAAVVPASRAHAQGQVGAILGATFSTLRGIDGLSSRNGLVGGLSIVLPTDGIFAFQPEALWVNKGAKASTGDPEGLKLSYFEIPLLYRIKLSREPGLRPHIYLGPYLGIQIDCSVRGTSTKCDDIPGVNTKTVDVGGMAGGGVDYDVGPFVLSGGARYSFGVSSVADFELGSVKESAKNGVFSLYAGAAIRLGGR